MAGMSHSGMPYGRQTILRGSIKFAHRAGPEAGVPETNAKLSSSTQADNGRFQVLTQNRERARESAPCLPTTPNGRGAIRRDGRSSLHGQRPVHL